MPNLVGQNVDAAMADATVRRLRLRITPRDDTMADGRPGVIVRQSIQESAPVEMGSPVTVWVATGVVVPALVGLDAEAARQQLTAKGLLARPSEVVRDRNPGKVVEQTPAAGAIVPRGAFVGFSVAVREMVKVPDVGRRDRRQALNLLTANRLTGEFSSDDDSKLTPGVVSGQEPGSGAEVPVGTTVRVRVASGVVVPSFIGSTPSEARVRIASSGLGANVTEVRTDAAPSGRVFEQRPGADARMARGSVVEVSVARPPFAIVPDLAQRSRAEAQSVAKAARLAVAFEEDPASTFPPGLVSRQDPAPGASVEVGTTVRAAVATGVLVPSVVNMPVQSARASLQAAGLRADERGEVSDRAPESTVTRQSPEPNARVARGTAVRLVIAARRTVTVPDSAVGHAARSTAILSPIPTRGSLRGRRGRGWPGRSPAPLSSRRLPPARPLARARPSR